MPRYDYFCSHNQKTIEVSHSFSEKIENWGELCQLAKLPLGDTLAQAPVNRIISGGIPINPNVGKNFNEAQHLAACDSSQAKTHHCSGSSCCH